LFGNSLSNIDSVMHEIEFAFLSHGLHYFWYPSDLLAKTSPAEVEILKGQIELLKLSLDSATQSSKQMADAFSRYVTTIQAGFAFITLIVLIGTFFFGKTLSETKQTISSTIDSEVKRELNKQLEATINTRIRYLEQVVNREEVVGTVSVEYLLPGGTKTPEEYRNLDARGFNISPLQFDLDKIFFKSDIFVLDLTNCEHSKSDKENLIRTIGEQIKNKPSKPIFVIYVPGRWDVIDQLPQHVYYLPVNGKVALMGAVVNAAHTTYALSHSNYPVPS
jgi:hypothetical protein